MNNETISAITRNWVETFVVDLQLCPFAKRELVDERVRFAVVDADCEEQLLMSLQSELELLDSDASVETSLLIHPHVLQDFAAYNQFLQLTDALLRELGGEGVYQVASFHPEYQFADTAVDDAENFTNRSPYPMLHLIREASLERAVAGYPDIDEVPQRNIALMNRMGTERLTALLRACHKL